MTKARGLGVGRVEVVCGGFRDAVKFELWVVPPGAPLPKPTPAVRPARRKRR